MALALVAAAAGGPQVIACAQGSEAWFAARAGIPTASTFAAILSKGTKKNEEATGRRNLRTKLVLERITGRRFAGFESFATRQGQEREGAARAAYEVATGDIVQQVGLVRHRTLACAASPDGLIGGAGGLEIKAPEPFAHLQALRTRRVPPEYVAQVQGGLWVCEREWWRFVSYNPDFPPGRQLVIVNAPRDEEYIAGLALAVALFIEEVCAEERELRALAGDG